MRLAIPSLAALVAICGCSPEREVEGRAEVGYVGRTICGECHPGQLAAWQGSPASCGSSIKGASLERLLLRRLRCGGEDELFELSLQPQELHGEA